MQQYTQYKAELMQHINLAFYRYLLRNFSARHLLFFVESDIYFGDDHLMFAFIYVKETALFTVKVAQVSSQ